MQTERLKTILGPLLESEGLALHSIRAKRAFGTMVAEILVESQGPVSSDQLERVHRQLLDVAGDDIIPDDWSIELSSVGIERPLGTKDDLIKAVGRHIFLASPSYKGNGDLIAFDGETMRLKVNLKGRMTTLDIRYADASQIRTAARF
jgi:ribosome maturation factor RimP